MMKIFEPWDLSVLDVENLRLHYAKTLRHWLERYEAASDEEALAAINECCQMEGILPAIESAHALAGAKRWARSNPGTRILVGLSGRGDKDMATLQSILIADLATRPAAGS